MKSCIQMSLFFDWPFSAQRYGKLNRPICFGDEVLVARAPSVAGKRVALLTSITNPAQLDALKKAQSVTDASHWIEP